MAGGRSNRRLATAALLAGAATATAAQSVAQLQAAGDIDKWDYLNGKLLNEKEAMQGKITDLQDHIADWKATELKLKLKLAALKNETAYDFFRLKASKPDLFAKKRLNHTFNVTPIIIPTEQAGPAQNPPPPADAADAKRAAKARQTAAAEDDLTADLPATKPVSVASAEKTPAVLLLDTRAKGSHSLGGAAAADAEACRAACLSGKVSDGTPLPGTCYATHFVGGACYFEGLAPGSDADADAEAAHGHACAALTLAAEKGVVSWVLPGVYSKAAGACGKGKKATPLVTLDGSAPAAPAGVKSFVQTTEEAGASNAQPLAEAAAAPAPQPSLRRRLLAVVGLAEAPAAAPLAEAVVVDTAAPTGNPLAKPPTVIETMLKTAAVVTSPDAQAAAEEWAAEEAAEDEEDEGEEEGGEWEEEEEEEGDDEGEEDAEGEWADDAEEDGEYDEEEGEEGEWAEDEGEEGEWAEDEEDGEWVEEGEEGEEEAADDAPAVVAAPTSFLEASPAAADETEDAWAADEDAAEDAEYDEALEGGEEEEEAEEEEAAADDAPSAARATIPLPSSAAQSPILRRLSRRLLQSGMLPDPHGGPAHGLNNVANAGAELTINGTANSLAAAVEAIRTVALTTTHGVHALVDLPLDAGGAALGGMGDGVRAMGVGVRSRMYAVREGHADAPDTATRYESADTAKSVAGMRAANQVAAGGLVPPDAAAAAAAASQPRIGQAVTMPATGGTQAGATGAVTVGSVGPAAALQAAAADGGPAPAAAAPPPKAKPSPEAVAAAKAAGPQPRVLALGAASALPSTDASVYLGTVANVPSADACAEMCRAHTAGTDNSFGRAVRVSPFAGTSLGEVSGYMSVSAGSLAADCVAASYYSAAKSNAGGAATADDAARVGHVCDLWAGLPTGPAAASNAAVLGGQASLLEFHPEPEGSGDSVAMVLVDRWDALTAATP